MDDVTALQHLRDFWPFHVGWLSVLGVSVWLIPKIYGGWNQLKADRLAAIIARQKVKDVIAEEIEGRLGGEIARLAKELVDVRKDLGDQTRENAVGFAKVAKLEMQLAATLKENKVLQTRLARLKHEGD